MHRTLQTLYYKLKPSNVHCFIPLLRKSVTCIRQRQLLIIGVHNCLVNTAAQDDDVVTSPYNAVLALHKLTEHADCVLPVDNQSLLEITAKAQAAAAAAAGSSSGTGRRRSSGMHTLHIVNNTIAIYLQ
jgi:Tubulin/FtsZ family, GTPase domain